MTLEKAKVVWEKAQNRVKTESDYIYSKPQFPTIQQVCQHMEKYWKALGKAHLQYLSLLKEEDLPADKFVPIEKDDDIYSLEAFVDAVKSTAFTDYDGFGCFTFKGKKADIGSGFSAVPSELFNGVPNLVFDGVVWYNK